MKVDKNGVVISDVVSAQNSAMDPNYIVMWDRDGIPIHIHKNVLEYLCAGMYGQQKAPQKPVAPVQQPKPKPKPKEEPPINLDDVFANFSN